MYTTYHLDSAEDADSRIIDAIKAAFKSRPITITVEEDDTKQALSQEMKDVLNNRLEEDTADYITREDSLKQLRNKYEV